jgi:hypothetical protein
MSKFSPSDAALEGFRLTRERPGTILAWGGVYFLGVMLMAAVMAMGLGPEFVTYLKDANLDPQEQAEFADLLIRSWPAFLLVLAMVLMIIAVLTAGVYRLVLRPHERGLAHLRLGADELRLAVVHLMLFSVGIGMLVAAELVVAGLSSDGPAPPGPVALVGAVLAVALIWVGVRLSLATPLTFAEKRISLGAAWRLTRGRFWSLFGMIVLAGVFYLMVSILIGIIGLAITALAGGREALAHPQMMSPVALVAFIVTLVLQLLMPILWVVTLYAPYAVAYREIMGLTPAPVELPGARPA